MTILVTGGNGYFGAVLVQRLTASGVDVRVLDLDPSGDHPDAVEQVCADVRDPTAVAAAVDGVETVYHCVAQVPLTSDRRSLWSVNVDGTVNVLTAAAAAGVGKVVHLSSSAVFGIPRSNPVLPDTVPRPREPYGAAKLAAEWACLRDAADGLDVTIVRPRTIVGHGRLGIFGLLFEWIADGADPFVLGDGSNRYQFVHADDLADVCIAAAARPGPRIYNVGTDRFGTMAEAIQSVCDHAGTGTRVRSLPARSAALAMRATAAIGLTPFAQYHWMMFGRSMWFDISRASAELAWRPRYSNAEMLAQSYDQFVARRDGFNDGVSGMVVPVPASPHRRVASSALLSVLKRLAKHPASRRR